MSNKLLMIYKMFVSSRGNYKARFFLLANLNLPRKGFVVIKYICNGSTQSTPKQALNDFDEHLISVPSI